MRELLSDMLGPDALVMVEGNVFKKVSFLESGDKVLTFVLVASGEGNVNIQYTRINGGTLK